MDATKDLIVEMSKKPISIIIVGIGETGFEFMEELDADKKVLKSSKNEEAARDIVQFVKFSDMKELATVEVAE